MITIPIRILAINPGSKYLGIAIFEQSDLIYWGIKVLKGKYSNQKLKKVKTILTDLIDRYEPNKLVIKKLHPSRSSPNLDRLVTAIKQFAKRKGEEIQQYSLKDIKDSLSSEIKINKREMVPVVISLYPFLTYPLEKEKRNKNPYFIRMFEAIALGITCFTQLDH